MRAGGKQEREFKYRVNKSVRLTLSAIMIWYTMNTPDQHISDEEVHRCFDHGPRVLPTTCP